jgi:hypothetical protein
MSIARAEQLKKDLTDKFVVVAKAVPELRRFEGLTGKVRTVNMNCRALVEFDGAVDISWYDIDPSYLQIVDAPLKKSAPEAHAAPAAEKPAAAPAAKPAGKSPLDQIRGGAAPAAPAGEKKASPLDLIRAKSAPKPPEQPAPAPEAVAAPAPAPEPPPAPVAEAPAAPKPAAANPGSTADILAAIRKKK